MSARRPDRVYFVRRGSDGAIKIGFTKRDKRLRWELARAAGEPLEQLLVVPGTMHNEQHLHRHFSSLRLDGEWFYPGSELLDFIGAVREAAPDALRVLKISADWWSCPACRERAWPARKVA